jgi:hypothetical protein
MAVPGDEIREGRDRGGLRASHADRERVIGILKVAFVQGRLTRDELDARTDQVYASRTYADLSEITSDIPAELAALTADLPAGLLARLPMAIDVRTGVCVTIAAAGVVAGILLWQPDNVLAFTMFLLAAVALCLAPVLTLGLMIDVRHQKRSGGQLPPGPNPGAGR